MISMGTGLGGCDLVLQLERPPEAQRFITFVQVKAEVPGDATSVTVTFDAAQTEGNFIVAAVGWASDSDVVSVTDQNGDYMLAVAKMTQGNLRQAIYYQPDIAAADPGGNTVTATFSENTTYPDIRIAEYAGIVRDDPFDVGTSSAGISVPMSSGFVATGHDHDLLVGAAFVQGQTVTPGDGFVGRIITVPNGDLLEDREVTEKGTYNATATQDRAIDWIMQLAAFRGY